MTWQGILGIFVSSIFMEVASVWIDDHLFANINKCEKCGHINGEDKK